MKLTRTNRIILAVAGLFILFLVLFPPYVSGPKDYRYWEGHHFVAAPPPRGSTRIAVGTLLLEVAAVVIATAVLMLLLGAIPRPKYQPDKGEEEGTEEAPEREGIEDVDVEEW